MDTGEYLQLFLADAREQLEALNAAVVRLEDTPDDPELIDEIFRIAHSLKGSSATMGFNEMASLTHEMEDVFELFKQRSEGLSREAIDALLACLDALEGCVESIDSTGTEHLDAAGLVERLQGTVRERSAAQDESREVPDNASPTVAAVAGEREVVHLVVRLADDCAMPSVRAFMVLAALGDHGEVVASVPALDEVDGFEDKRLEAWVATEHEADAVVAAAAEVPDVAEAAAQPGEATAESPEPAAVQATPAAGSQGGEPDSPVAQAGTAPPERKSAGTVRVDAERLDQLMHHMGELVVQRTRVESIADPLENPELHHAMQELTRASQALQHMVMQVRMIPVEAVFLRFPRLVRDLSRKLDKQAELEIVGQDTELDRTVVDALGGPLAHLVRNALDHGLETVAEREAAGKPPTGTVEIAARHAGGNVVVSVRDDGRGIDAERVARKAVERGLIAPEEAPAVDAARAAELLFEPGFSTTDEANDISGRGVGMDAVRTAIRDLGGEVTMTSELGAGTTAQIRLPLTLAIIAALLVESGGESFAIPLDRVDRTVRVADYATRSVAGRRMLVLSEGALPLLDASHIVGGEPTDCEYAVLIRGASGRLALGVERLVGQRELVTRALPAEAADAAAVTGGAVMADGGISVIVDCDALGVDGPVLVAAA